MSDASRFRRVTPRAYWLTTALAALLLLPGAGLALDTSEEALFSQQDPKQPQQSQTLRLTGSVIERGTKKPIADAKVVVQRIIRKQHLQTDRKSYERRTDARGRYQLDLQGNELEFDEMSFLATLSDPHFVDAESKRAHGNMRTKGERVEVLNIAPIEGLAGDRISGVVKRPDGKPVLGVRVRLSSTPTRATTQLHPTVETSTDNEGRFAATVARGFAAMLFLEPNEFVPQRIKIGDKRGDLGVFRLSAGLEVRGRVLDDQNNVIKGAWVSIQTPLPYEEPFEERDLSANGSSYDITAVSTPFRSVQTDRQGRFNIPGIKPTRYLLTVSDRPAKPADLNGTPTILSSAFERQAIIVRANAQPEEIILRGLPSIGVKAQFLDGSGAQTTPFEGSVVGDYRGEPYFAWLRTMEGGKAVAKVPKGTTNLRLLLLRFFKDFSGCLRGSSNVGTLAA